ncbi:hypothetical protein GCM10009530_22690 [Microbispora corallina]|uniref:SGNH hydrolase-type esterase domain-containing protein n=1 Tax=Microbispora corallina TaxID=83302 RepID=A0ABQ4G6B4_9ACTN|nr:hypothetical protein Mco01_56110 [Microbispora corallina]
MEVPDAPPREWVAFDGTIALTGAGLSITIETDEALTNATQWQTLLIAIGALAANLGSRTLCLLFFLSLGPVGVLAKSVCAGLGAFMGTFVDGALTIAVNKTSSDLAWSNLLIRSLVYGLGAAAWEAALGPFIDVSGQAMVEKAAATLLAWGQKLQGWWWTSAFGRTVAALSGNLTAYAPGVRGSFWDAARRAGFTTGGVQLRVLPLGDSITYGVGGTPPGTGYRASLWNQLADDVETLDFVGSVKTGQLPDTDHEGHPGWRISQIDSLVSDCTIRRYRPNVVTLHIGTNDMAQNDNVATAPDRLRALIDKITDISPSTTVFVATLIPSTSPVTNARIQQYNAQIPAIVTGLRNEGKRVRAVSMSAVTTADLVDSLHPGNTGYRKMADAFARAITLAKNEGQLAPLLPGDPGACDPDPSVPPPAPPTPTTLDGWKWAGEIASGVGAIAESVRFADLNGDGRDDYLVVDEQGKVRAWYKKPGSGWEERGRSPPASARPGRRCGSPTSTATDGPTTSWSATRGRSGRGSTPGTTGRTRARSPRVSERWGTRSGSPTSTSTDGPTVW